MDAMHALDKVLAVNDAAYKEGFLAGAADMRERAARVADAHCSPPDCYGTESAIRALPLEAEKEKS